MKKRKYEELEKRIAALEKTLKEQQNLIERLVTIKDVNNESLTLKHPTLFDSNMLC